MLKIFDYIKSFIKKIQVILAIAALVFLVLFVRHLIKTATDKVEQKLKVTEYNLRVSKDSIRLVKDKLNHDEFNKLAYLTDKIDVLTESNADLTAQIKAIKGNVNTIIKTDVKVVEKPVPFLVTSEQKDSIVTVNFKLDTIYSAGNYRNISGYTIYNTINKNTRAQKLTDEIGVSLITGIKNLDKGKPEIFLKSDYPGLTITNLEGAVIDPSLLKGKNHTPLITPGITIGWTPISWDNRTQKLTLSTRSVGVTAGLSFNILKLLRFKK